MRIVVTPDRKAVVLNDDGTWTDAPSCHSALERWKSLTLSPDLVERYRGVCDRLGVRIIDTGEALTCVHRGDRIDFEAGIDEASVETTVVIYGYQAERLAQQVERGPLQPIEEFRIARELLVSSAGASAKDIDNPLSSHPILRRFIRAKNLIHVYLLSPDKNEEPDATYSLVHVNGHSLLMPGLHGQPERVFRLNVEDALEFHRNLAGLESRGWTSWLKMGNWYVSWRKKVEVPS